MIPSPHILLNNGKENKIMINSKIQTQILISNSKRRLRRHIYDWGHLPGLSATSRESEIFNPILNTRKQLSYLVLRDLVAPRSVTPAPSNSQWLSAECLFTSLMPLYWGAAALFGCPEKKILTKEISSPQLCCQQVTSWQGFANLT